MNWARALTSCKLDFHGSLPPSPTSHRIEKAKALSAHIDSTIRMVRRISTGLRPCSRSSGPRRAGWQANEFQNRTGIAVMCDANLREPCSAESEHHLFFASFQEILPT